jgi:hypothetical protein
MGKSTDALDEQIANEEMTPMTADEKIWCEMTLQAVPEDQRKSFGSVHLDVLCVIYTFSRPPSTPPYFLPSIALWIPLSPPRVLTTPCTYFHAGNRVC